MGASAAASIRLIITGVASTAIAPDPTRGAVCSGATVSSAAPARPGWMAERSGDVDMAQRSTGLVAYSTLKSLGSHGGTGYCGFMASRGSRTMAAIAALRAHLRSAGMTCHGAHDVVLLCSMIS